MKITKIILFASIAFLLIGCLNLPEKQSKMKLTLDNKNYLLEVAKNQEQREQGLMNRRSLKENEGMIFYFDKPDYQKFWMKNTYIPLQIILIDGCKIVDQQEMPVESDPENPNKNYVSRAPADKAIELNTQTLPDNLIGEEINELCAINNK